MSFHGSSSCLTCFSSTSPLAMSESMEVTSSSPASSNSNQEIIRKSRPPHDDERCFWWPWRSQDMIELLFLHLYSSDTEDWKIHDFVDQFPKLISWFSSYCWFCDRLPPFFVGFHGNNNCDPDLGMMLLSCSRKLLIGLSHGPGAWVGGWVHQPVSPGWVR